MKKKAIIYLRRSQLEPHPQNPRKDLGDLEELRESIRVNGIMQNLTVIPTDDTLEHFYILIGHRRFAASEGILDELKTLGFSVPLEGDEDLVRGKSDLFAKLENLRS